MSSCNIPIDHVHDVTFGEITRTETDYRRTIRIRCGDEGRDTFNITLISQKEFKLAMLARPIVGERSDDPADPPCELCGIGGCDDNDGQYHWHQPCREKFIREYNNYLDADLIVAMTNAEIGGSLVNELGNYLAGDRDIDNQPIF